MANILFNNNVECDFFSPFCSDASVKSALCRSSSFSLQWLQHKGQMPSMNITNTKYFLSSSLMYRDRRQSGPNTKIYLGSNRFNNTLNTDFIFVRALAHTLTFSASNNVSTAHIPVSMNEPKDSE